MDERIFGMSWEEIQNLQIKRARRPNVDLTRQGDYGADPVGDGMYRMIPSGDIVDWDERSARLARHDPL